MHRELYDHMNRIQQLEEEVARVYTGDIRGTAGTSGTSGTENPTPEGDETDLREIANASRIAARALYQYSMLASALGLDPNMKKAIHEIQEMAMMVMNMMRAIAIIEGIMNLESPLGWVDYIKLIGAGGAIAASVGYSVKLGSGQ